MNGEVYSVTPAQVQEILRDNCPELPVDAIRTLVSAAEVSIPCLVGMYGGTPVCVFGFVPETILSDTAHLWLHVTPDLAQHRTKFGRHAVRAVSRALEFYPKIVGHCWDSRSIRWLMTLGAEIEHGRFTIRRPE